MEVHPVNLQQANDLGKLLKTWHTVTSLQFLDHRHLKVIFFGYHVSTFQTHKTYSWDLKHECYMEQVWSLTTSQSFAPMGATTIPSPQRMTPSVGLSKFLHPSLPVKRQLSIALCSVESARRSTSFQRASSAWTMPLSFHLTLCWIASQHGAAMRIEFTNLTNNQKWWRENYKDSRQPGQGCHVPGARRRSGKELFRTEPTKGSSTQKRKLGRLKHTPHQK